MWVVYTWEKQAHSWALDERKTRSDSPGTRKFGPYFKDLGCYPQGTYWTVQELLKLSCANKSPGIKNDIPLDPVGLGNSWGSGNTVGSQVTLTCWSTDHTEQQRQFSTPVPRTQRPHVYTTISSSSFCHLLASYPYTLYRCHSRTEQINIAEAPDFVNLERFSQILLGWVGPFLRLAPITNNTLCRAIGSAHCWTSFLGLRPLEWWRVRENSSVESSRFWTCEMTCLHNVQQIHTSDSAPGCSCSFSLQV